MLLSPRFSRIHLVVTDHGVKGPWSSIWFMLFQGSIWLSVNYPSFKAHFDYYNFGSIWLLLYYLEAPFEYYCFSFIGLSWIRPLFEAPFDYNNNFRVSPSDFFPKAPFDCHSFTPLSFRLHLIIIITMRLHLNTIVPVSVDCHGFASCLRLHLIIIIIIGYLLPIFFLRLHLIVTASPHYRFGSVWLLLLPWGSIWILLFQFQWIVMDSPLVPGSIW